MEYLFLTAAAALTLLLAPMFRATAQGVSGDVPSPYLGESRKAVGEEVTRLASASAILLGSLFRRRVIERARAEHQACAPEIGLDFETLLHVCRWAEARETVYDVAMGFGALVTLGLLASEELVLAAVSAAVLIVGSLYKRFEERFRLARFFRRGVYDAAEVRRVFRSNLSEPEKAGLPKSEQNLLVYNGFMPFESAGFPVGGWSFVIDAGRGKKDLAGGVSTAEGFATREVAFAIEEAISSITHPGLRCRDYVVMHGSCLPGLVVPASGRAFRRVQRIAHTPDEVRPDGLDDRARHYKWIRIQDWGGEMVISSFFFCTRIANDLFVECRHHLLTALAPQYRKIDALTYPTWWTGVRWFCMRLLLAPRDVLGALAWLLYRPIAALPRVLGLEEWWARVIMEDEPRYNYGAQPSVRRSMAGESYTHYFQKVDYELLSKLVDKRILDALVQFLDARGVDTSELKEQQTAILNNGIIVQGGDVKADGLAVGRGAKVSGFLKRRRLKRQAQVARSA
jgi:hypothetical protein